MKVTDWYGSSINPVRKGYYEVRNYGCWKRRNRLIAGFHDGRQLRYWNGYRWLTEKDGGSSIFGRCHSHQWRGLSRRPSRG